MSTVAYEYTEFDRYSPYPDAGPYTADDYWRLPEGEPVELIRGRLIMSPAPIPYHQALVLELAYLLRTIEESAGGKTLVSPVDVVLDSENIFQPDVIYLSKDRLHQIGDRINGSPSLVIEVLSPSTGNRDKQEKLDLYAKFGVPEYWIVDPEKQTFDFLVHDRGRFVVTTPDAGVYRSAVTPEIEIKPVEFWAEANRRMPRGKA